MADVKELNVNNTTYDIKAKSVVDTNSGKLFFWSGTKNQFDAIVTKDANTLYNITDDTDVSLTILEALYPVGSIYITTANTCPLSTLIAGSTWSLVSSGIVQAGDIPCKGNGMTLGLTNGTSNGGLSTDATREFVPYTGVYGQPVGTAVSGNIAFAQQGTGITTDATKSGIIADTSSLTLAVNIFERTA